MASCAPARIRGSGSYRPERAMTSPRPARFRSIGGKRRRRSRSGRPSHAGSRGCAPGRAWCWPRGCGDRRTRRRSCRSTRPGAGRPAGKRGSGARSWSCRWSRSRRPPRSPWTARGSRSAPRRPAPLGSCRRRAPGRTKTTAPRRRPRLRRARPPAGRSSRRRSWRRGSRRTGCLDGPRPSGRPSRPPRGRANASPPAAASSRGVLANARSPVRTEARTGMPNQS